MDKINSNYDKDIFVAEKIIDTKMQKSKRYFLIKWQGWDKSDNTWEPEENILDKNLISIYFKSINHSKSNSKNKKIKSNKSSENNLNKKEIDINKSKSEPITLNKKSNEINTNINDSSDDDLRSAKRIAEGLRPISKNTINKSSSASSLSISSSQTPSPSQLAANLLIKKLKNNKIKSSSSQNSSIVTSTPNNLKIKNQDQQKIRKKISLRKLSSSSESNISKDSTHYRIPRKRRIILNKKYIYSDEDDEEEDEDILNVNYENKTKSLNNDDSSLINKSNISDDIFITDITSGVVTVTIQECITADGFFKKRDSES